MKIKSLIISQISDLSELRFRVVLMPNSNILKSLGFIAILDTD